MTGERSNPMQSSTLWQCVSRQSDSRVVQAGEWALGLVTTLAICAPRTTWICLILMMIVVAIIAWRSRVDLPASAAWLQTPGRLWLVPGGFLVWATLSALWSLDPMASLAKGTQFLGLLACLWLLTTSISRLAPEPAFHLARGVAVGVFSGTSYLLFELVSQSSIIFQILEWAGGSGGLVAGGIFYVEGELYRIFPVALNRHTLPAILLLWPCLAWIWLTQLSASTKMILSVFLGSLAGSAIALSDNESAKLALFCSALVLPIALRSRVKIFNLLRFAVVVATLLIVPLSLLAHSVGLHKAGFVQSTGQQRIEIWQATAQAVTQSPVLGIGAEATRKLDLRLKLERHGANAPEQKYVVNNHAHNAYLQIWLELGAVGAVLFCLFGWLCIAEIAKISDRIRHFVVAQFVCVAALLSVAYGVWQVWYFAAIALSVAGMALVARIATRTDAGVNAAEPVRALTYRRLAASIAVVLVVTLIVKATVPLTRIDEAIAAPKSVADVKTGMSARLSLYRARGYLKTSSFGAAHVLLNDAQRRSATGSSVWSIATYHLGESYLLGRGVKPDLARAKELLEHPALKRMPRARYLLGTLYAKPTFFEHDINRARVHLREALKLGYKRAAKLLTKLDAAQ